MNGVFVAAAAFLVWMAAAPIDVEKMVWSKKDVFEEFILESEEEKEFFLETLQIAEEMDGHSKRPTGGGDAGGGDAGGDAADGDAKGGDAAGGGNIFARSKEVVIHAYYLRIRSFLTTPPLNLTL